jgi:hypothetical protein
LDDREMVDRRGTAPRATILQGSSAPLCAARALSWFRSTLSCSSGRRFHQISFQGELERPAGYDPTSSAWRAETLPLSYGRVVGRGRIRTSEPLKGRRLRRRCFGLLHTCPCWLRRAELNGLPLGYEPSELPVLHSASIDVVPFVSATPRRYIRGRTRNGGRPRS